MLFFTFLLFTAGVFAVTMYITRKDDHDSSDGYFLGGRSLTAGFIAGSLMLTNLSTEQLVGLNGSAFINGLSVMAWEVVAAISLVIMALFFLPKFLRSGIATVPQFLEERFNATTRKITSIIFIFAYAVILLPLILFTGAKGMISILGLTEMLNMEFTQCLWIVVILIGVIGSIYAIFGGLKAVAVSDTLNGFGLLVGGIAISYFALSMVGDGKGIFEGYNIVKEGIPQKFNAISNPDGDVPFYTLFTGVLLLNLFYWTTNQQIIQRTFGATNLAEGQKGVLLAGGLKVLGPLILVLPGLLAFYFHQNGLMEMPLKADGSPDADQAYGVLVQTVMPEWMKGFFSAVLLGAILSSFNSALNSTCTLFSLGVYKGIIKKNATEDQVIGIGKKFGWIIAISSMIIAPLLEGQASIFGYLQKMNAIYFVPIFAVVLVGMLTKRVPAIAANTGMVFAFAVIIGVYFVPGMGGIIDPASGNFIFHNFHFIAIVLLTSIAIMLIIGQVKPMAQPFIHKHSGDVDMTPWKGAKPAGIILIAIVVAIYVNFADMSVIGEVEGVEKVCAALFVLCGAFAIFKFAKEKGNSTKNEDSDIDLEAENSHS
ncbi:MAG: solute:sodium symporter family transporter [Lentisphaerales bacterium]|nr:solute:sodium symporter family transporter [Lentisphaerales bacterium]